MLEDLSFPILAAVQVAFVFALSPLLIGIMRKVKARYQGRTGSPVIQPYIDVIKLLSKGTAKSSVASFIFAITPIVGFASIAIAALMLPIMSQQPLLATNIIIFIYLFSIGRFLTALSGLDAGSAFGGMGSSREMLYSVLIEPALFAAIIFLAASGGPQIAPLAPDLASWQSMALTPAYWLIAISLFIAILAETGRLPFDNPATHLELTMVHEAMILENSGPDLALIEWAHAAKIFLFFSLMGILLVPGSLQASPFWPAILLAFTMIMAAFVAAIESVSVKIRLFTVPEPLILSVLLALLAFLTRVFFVKPAGGGVLQTLMSLAMLLLAIYFIFSITFRQRLMLYVIQGICMVVILLQISFNNGTAGATYLLLVAATVVFKIIVIPFVLYRLSRGPQNMSFGETHMPLMSYLRFGVIAEKLKLNLDFDPIFLDAPVSTRRTLLYASALIVLAFLISPVLGGTTLMLPLVISLILVGMLIIAVKTHVLLQLMGFLIMENGVVLLPSALRIHLPLIGEAVTLFDVVVLVAIALLLSFKMRETHGSLDTKKLIELIEKR